MSSTPFTILVADDIPLMRLMLTKYVKSAGGSILESTLGPVDIRVLEAGDGEEAGNLLRTNDVQLLFLDLMMPVKDGLTLLEEIQHDPRQSDLAVVICSAIGDKEVVNKALSMGAKAYIVKPFTLHAVEERLQKIYGSPTPAPPTS